MEEKLTPAFWKWFGNSKVVDKNGDPLIVYHGTNKYFTIFDQKKGDLGWHFGTKIQANALVRNHYPNNKTFVIPVYLKIERPLIFPDIHHWEDPYHVLGKFQTAKSYPILRELMKKASPDFSEMRSILEANGIDGIVYRNEYEGSKKADSFLAFRAYQIKSADKNDGSFDSNDNDIRSNPNFYETETHDDWGRDEYFARLEDAMRSSVKHILDEAADFPIVRLARKDGMQLIVHQTSQSGKNNWQVSWLDKYDIPEMHTLFKKREDALRSIAGAGGGESIGVPGEWKVIETRNVRR